MLWVFSQRSIAHQTFVSNLNYACEATAELGIKILIEPLNPYDAPGYFQTTTDQARDTIKQVAADNLALLFDCYHVQLIEADLSHRLIKLMPIIGHLQFS